MKITQKMVEKAHVFAQTMTNYFEPAIVSVSQLGLENSVGAKFGRSEEAVSGFFLQLC